MKLCILHLNRAIRWNVHPEDPVSFPIVAGLDIELFNPFSSIVESQERIPILLPDTRIHVVTHDLYLKMLKDPDENFYAQICDWLRLLRLVSKQASLPNDLVSYIVPKGVEGQVTLKLPTKFPKVTIFGRFHLETAIDKASINRAYELDSDNSIPICHELILDALLASETRRYRESILYSAIAIESLAKYSLDRAYQEAIVSTNPPQHLNILNFPQPGGDMIKKDPIFTLLNESDNFSRLIHEAPLYLSRRSLLNDDSTLYARAKSLYQTRNRLSHGQQISTNDSHLLSVDGDGAKEAVDTAIRVFAWLGEHGYHVPDSEHVELGGGDVAASN